MVVKIRDGLVANRPIYCAIGVIVDGERDILGLWVGTGGEGGKYWLQVLTGIKNRGVKDVWIVVSDGLTGMTESISATWPEAIRQACELHLIRNTFRYASRRYWPAIAADLRPVYRARTEAAARQRFEEFDEKWGSTYPAVNNVWKSAWSEFVPFLLFDPEIRSVVCSTNAIESDHAGCRRAVRARGHFPTEKVALKCVYLTVRSLDPTGTGRQRWMNRWKQPLNAFAVTFEGRILARVTDTATMASYTDFLTLPDFAMSWFRASTSPQCIEQIVEPLRPRLGAPLRETASRIRARASLTRCGAWHGLP